MDLSESRQESLTIDEIHSKQQFQHSYLRISLIILALVSFILVCVFNGLASRPNSSNIFIQQTGIISDRNLTELTPAGWTFSIWGVIYFWQATWLIYALSRIKRKSNTNYLYIYPNTLHYVVFIFYILNMCFNIGWLFLWDREYFGWSCFVLLFMFVTVIIPMIITHVLLQRNRSIYIDSNQTLDIWFVRIFVHNGLAVYATWLYLACLLNLTIWISNLEHRNLQTIARISTISLSLILIGIIGYFLCENFLFYSSMSYTFLPWFVFIFALSGIVSKHSTRRKDVTQLNQNFAFSLLILVSILFLIRLSLFILRYIKRR